MTFAECRRRRAGRGDRLDRVLGVVEVPLLEGGDGEPVQAAA